MQHQLPGMGSKGGEEVDYISRTVIPETAEHLKAVWNVGVIVFGWLSITLEVSLRREFGERYLSWLRIIIAYLLLCFFLVVTGLFYVDGWDLLSRPLSYLLLTFNDPLIILFCILAGWHQGRIRKRRREGKQWHSMSFGISRIADLGRMLNIQHPLVSNDWTVFRFTEPILCIFLSLIVGQYYAVWGNWMILASLSLLIKNQMMYYQQRNRILDIVDGRIEAQYFMAAAEGKPKTQTSGFSVVPGFFDAVAPASPPDMAAAVREAMPVAFQQQGRSEFAVAVNEAMDIPDDEEDAPHNKHTHSSGGNRK